MLGFLHYTPIALRLDIYSLGVVPYFGLGDLLMNISSASLFSLIELHIIFPFARTSRANRSKWS